MEAKLVQKKNEVIGQPLTAHEHWYIDVADMDIVATCVFNANDFKTIAIYTQSNRKI